MTATEAQWRLSSELQAAFPDATVHASRAPHRMEGRSARRPRSTMYGVIVTLKVGPFDLRREYAAPDGSLTGNSSGRPRRSHRARHFRLDGVLSRHS